MQKLTRNLRHDAMGENIMAIDSSAIENVAHLARLSINER